MSIISGSRSIPAAESRSTRAEIASLTRESAGEHTEEHVARQRELADHNGKLVSVGYMIWG